MKLLLIAFLYVVVGAANIASAQSQTQPSDPDPSEPPSQSRQPTQSNPDEYLKIIDVLQIDDLRNTMMRVGVDGLNPRRYWTEDMEWYYQQGTMNQGLKNQANLNFLQLLQDISLGIVDPETMGRDVKLKRKDFITPQQLQVMMLTSGSQAGPLLATLSPQSAQYKALKEALKRMTGYCMGRDWMPLPDPVGQLQFGSQDKSISFIKNRLKQFGYSINTDNEIFDDEVQSAIEDIQWLLRIKPDGIISPNGKTWKYLNASCLDLMRQIRADMEKIRWFQQTFEDRYIFVNLAMTYFTLVDKTNGNINTIVFRTINGRPARPTPTMKDRIVTIIINPFWVVPPTIFREDKLADLRYLSKDQVAEYFANHHYEVWNSAFTQQIDPTTIDWSNLDASADNSLFIRQRPFLGNALGVLKFLLTNTFAIYLHDTNQRELFGESQRLLSSGCVRLERPLDLAEYLLQGTTWSRDNIQQAMAKPGEVMIGETKAPLQKPMPLYLVFLTSQLTDDGILRFVDDAYGQNRRLLQKGVW
ncbi:MAG: L,D-transpeptidase family protein [Pseudobdellovibrionaceae bacterium]